MIVSPMKMLCVDQPYAFCIAQEWKLNETRPVMTSYRGDIAIQATLRRMRAEDLERIYAEAGLHMPAEPHAHGVVLCVVELWEVRSTLEIRESYLTAPRELHLGNYADGRYAWRLRNVRKLRHPVPAKGFQGLRDIDPIVGDRVRQQVMTMDFGMDFGGDG